MEHKLFGCKVNKYFLNKWLNYFESSQDYEVQNSVLVASCVVTDRAKKKRVKEIKGYLQAGKKVYLTWCGAFDRSKAMDQKKFFQIYPMLKNWESQIILLPESPPNVASIKKESKNIFTKKFVVIQLGCDTWCSFCLTVAKRWKHHSRPAEQIIDEILAFQDQWGKEIVLTGVNLAAWWASNTKKPQEAKLGQLLELILKRTSIPRIRISSLGPEFLNNQFFEVIEDKRILPYFHLSIQSFSTSVLAQMRRQYDLELLENVFKRFTQLKREDKDQINFGADIIVGFPWETQQDFQITYDKVKEFGITKLHAFPFSPHLFGESVPASKFANQVLQPVKKQRERLLLALGKSLRQDFIKKNIGKYHRVLIEEIKDGKSLGRTSNYIKVALPWSLDKGQIHQIILKEDQVIL